MLYTLVVQQH